jgi:hypothetical protein
LFERRLRDDLFDWHDRHEFRPEELRIVRSRVFGDAILPKRHLRGCMFGWIHAMLGCVCCRSYGSKQLRCVRHEVFERFVQEQQVRDCGDDVSIDVSHRLFGRLRGYDK